jgi:hypothetical protein
MCGCRRGSLRDIAERQMDLNCASQLTIAEWPVAAPNGGYLGDEAAVIAA